MATKTYRQRKTERREAYVSAERDYWDSFKSKVASCNAYLPAVILSRAAPGSAMPGRRFHQNLSALLIQNYVTENYGEQEADLYIDLIERLSQNGTYKEWKAKELIEAIKSRYPSR
jgi:hypothetical protein